MLKRLPLFMSVLFLMLLVVPKQSYASNQKDFTCCQNEIKKFRATRLDFGDIRETYMKTPVGENEFKRKRSAERIEVEKKKYNKFFNDAILYTIEDTNYLAPLRISEYDFDRHEFHIEYGYDSPESNRFLLGEQIYTATENGNRIELPPLKINEKDAEQIAKSKNKSLKLFIVYKLIKVDKFPTLSKIFGSNEYVRISIKLIYAKLIAGKNTFVIFDNSSAELSDRTESELIKTPEIGEKTTQPIVAR